MFKKIIKQRTLITTGSKLATLLTNSVEKGACCEANGS